MPIYNGKTVTKMCVFFAAGDCQRDALCTFGHSIEELGREWPERSALHRRTMCKFWQADGSGSSSPQQHPFVSTCTWCTSCTWCTRVSWNLQSSYLGTSLCSAT